MHRRISEQFVDATLATADGRTIKCHKILLSAGSGLLEELLAANPSDHPTVVLSRIRHADLRLIVDFMYSGEVAVEHARLPGLLEAARLLRIKGLWDSEQVVITFEISIIYNLSLKQSSLSLSLSGNFLSTEPR